MSYTPSQKNEEWLNWLLERIKGVPYTVTARWAFYRLVEEFRFQKSDYKRFLGVTSKARKNYWNGWNPETMPDDTREMIGEYGTGFKSVNDWFDSQAHKRPKLMMEHKQDNIVFVCFEAKAMIGQFKHYLEKYRVCLFPFGGDPSIPFKYKLAEEIDHASKFGKPIKVLYFGDYDPKGMMIPESAMNDVRQWTGVNFDYIRIGINDGHIEEMGITEDPTHPGKFQWEALDEKAAEELINKVFKYWNKDVVDTTKKTESKAADIWNTAVESAIEEAKEMLGDD